MSQHKKLDLLEFCEQYTNVKLTELQEAVLRHDSKLNPVGSWNWYRQLGADKFTCGRLLKMKQGEEFVLVAPDGARRFVLTEIRPVKTDFEPVSPGVVDEGVLGPDKKYGST